MDMNWYDGIVVDQIWVKYSKIWIIKGAEDLPYTKNVRAVLIERGIMILILAVRGKQLSHEV
jgi:hypothetical protein